MALITFGIVEMYNGSWMTLSILDGGAQLNVQRLSFLTVLSTRKIVWQTPSTEEIFPVTEFRSIPALCRGVRRAFVFGPTPRPTRQTPALWGDPELLQDLKLLLSHVVELSFYVSIYRDDG